MFKKKPIYIVLLIIFSLVLCAEAALCILLPSSFEQNPMNQMGMQMPEGFDPENMPQGMQIPEGFDPENMPQGMQMPEGFDAENMPQGMQMPEGFDAENMPEGFGARGEASADSENREQRSSSRRPSMGAPSAQNSFSLLYTLKSLWLPIILVCIAGDVFCIIRLTRISRKKKAESAPEESEQTPSEKKEEIHKKNKKRRIISLVIVVVFVAVVALLPTMVSPDTDISSAEIKEELISAQAQTGDLTRTLLSGGVLTDDDTIAVSIPADVEIDEFAVEDGDTVKTGDLIATVESSSLMIAIAEMQEGIDALDERLEDAADATMKTTVTIPSDGRVKKIFAAAGDDVVDTMYENSALMLVSLDGLMAVDIETNQLSIGDHVLVTLADGTQQDGRVAGLSNGIASVTVSDETAAYGENVSVADESGAALGTGSLYIHSELKITGYAGTISEVYAEENAKLAAGKKLLSIEEENYTANYSALYRERIELEESLSKLLRIYQDGGIYAECDGMITGISDSEEATDETAEDVLNSYQMSGWGMMQPRLTSAEPDDTPDDTNPDNANPDQGDAEPDGGETPPQEPPTDPAPQNGGFYPAMVTRVSYGSIRIMTSPAPLEQVDPANFTVDERMLTVNTELKPTSSTVVVTYLNGAPVEKTLSDLQTGDLLLCEYDGSGTLTKIIYRRTDQQQQGSPSIGGFPQGMMGGSSMMSMMDTMTQETVEEEYKLTKTAVCEIIPDELMTISISVDELDILSLSVGQQATVKPDSMSGRSFTGEIIEIDRKGVNEGGNTKYTVQIQLPREQDMLSGMNASVVIELGKLSDLVTVPAEALREDGAKTVIYTGYDEKRDLLTKPVEVTTGYSDGTSVEITSGLSLGDTYYYRYADTITYSFK